MKTIYKRFIVGILSLVAILSVGFMLNASQMSKPVLATTDYDFTMENGASIRTELKTDIGDIENAIRFSTYLKKSDVPEGVNVEVYTLIAKYDELKEQIPEVNESNFTNYMTREHFINAEVPCVNVPFTGDRLLNDCEQDDNYYQYNACIYNLTDEELTTEFVARSYLVINGDTENAKYTEIAVKRSIFDVAQTIFEEKGTDSEAQEAYDSNPKLIEYLSTKFQVTINSDFEESVTLNIPRGQKLSDFKEDYKEISANKEGLAYYNGFKEGETAFDVEKAISGDNTEITLTADYTSLKFELWNDAGEEGYAVTGYESGFFSSERTELNIPEGFKYKGNKVICVGVNAFKSCSVKIAKLFADIKYIGQGAFYNCPNLETIIMPYATVFYAKGENDTNYDYTGQSLEARNIFYKSNNLETAVVNSEAIIARKTFFTDDNNSKTDLYIDGAVNKIVIKNNNDMLTDSNRYLKGTKCGEWQYDSDGMPFVAVKEHTYNETCTCTTCGHVNDQLHNYIDGICTTCGDYQTKGLSYTYNATYGGYMVSYGSCTANEVYVPKEYDDGGANGKKDVVGLAASAFWAKTVKKIVLPKTVKYATTFSLGGLGGSVETIIMPGITEFYGTEDIKLFWNNSNLKTIVVSPDIVWGKNVFANNNKFTEINICVDSTEKWVEMPADSNGVVTGNIFLYNATSNAQCGSWTYVDGIPTPSTATHNYTEANPYVCTVCGNIKEHTHVDNLEDPTGKCKYCDKVLSEGLTYTYNGTLGGYVVSPSSTFTADKLFVLGEYDDGSVNGKHDVVAAKGFANNNNITMVVLPEQVKYLIANCFAACGKLTTIIMPGVLGPIANDTTTTIDKTARNNTLYNSDALKAAVVNPNLIMNRYFFGSTQITTGELVLYINGDTDKNIYKASNNNILNGTTYLKSEWQYNSEGIPTPNVA